MSCPNPQKQSPKKIGPGHNGIEADVVGNDLPQGRDDAAGLRRHPRFLVREPHAEGARRRVAVAGDVGSRGRDEGDGDGLLRSGTTGLCKGSRNQGHLGQAEVAIIGIAESKWG